MKAQSYTFKTQLAQGEEGEARLDAHFAQWFKISAVSPAQQRQGIDRIWQDKHGKQYLVEYKTDRTAGMSGNAFVETVSVDRDNKPGWAYTSQASLLVYYIPEPETIYVLRMAEIRRRIDDWRRRYAERAIPNQGYKTHGVLVPLHEFERLALVVF